MDPSPLAKDSTSDIVSVNDNKENDIPKTLGKDQQIAELVRKRLRREEKRMQRIVALETTLNSSKGGINEEQKSLLASKDFTTKMIKEYAELQAAVNKILDEGKKSVSNAPVSESTQAANKETARNKRKNKKNQKPSSNDNSEKPTTAQQDQPPKETVKIDEVNQNKPQPNQTPQITPPQNTHQNSPPNTPPQQTIPASTANSNPNNNTNININSNTTTAPLNKPETPNSTPQAAPSNNQEPERKEWMNQRDIYNAKFKTTFSEDQKGKFIGVVKGVLYGPFDKLEQLKTATGGGNKEEVFIARVGHEDEPKRRGNFRGRGRERRVIRREGRGGEGGNREGRSEGRSEGRVEGGNRGGRGQNRSQGQVQAQDHGQNRT